MQSALYARCFDSSCKAWADNREYNLMILSYYQTYFNDLLKTRGYVFLRDIYEALGFPITKERVVVGWWYDLSGFTRYKGIDFGINYDTTGIDFLLNFNVMGSVIEHL